MYKDNDPVFCLLFPFLAIIFADQAFAIANLRSLKQL